MSTAITHELVVGNSRIVDYFQTAIEKWSEIVGTGEFDDVSALASWCSSNQHSFERECGGRHLGQDVMVVSGISQFYDPVSGWGDRGHQNAKQVYSAFMASSCSVEVKYAAERASKAYDLEED